METDRHTSQFGFTILEIVISVAILGIAALLGSQLLNVSSRSSLEIEVAQQFGIARIEIEAALDRNCRAALLGQSLTSSQVVAAFTDASFQGYGVYNRTLQANERFGDFVASQVAFVGSPEDLDGGTLLTKLEYKFRSAKAPWIRESQLTAGIDLVVWPMLNSVNVLECARARTSRGNLLRVGIVPTESWAATTFYPGVGFCQTTGHSYSVCDAGQPGIEWANDRLRTLVESP